MTRRSYILTRGASADIREISRYTDRTWGAAKRRNYLNQLQDAASQIAEGRGVYEVWGAVLPGLRVKAIGSHYIFCLSRHDRPALILAILHERMDLLTRLKARLDRKA